MAGGGGPARWAFDAGASVCAAAGVWVLLSWWALPVVPGCGWRYRLRCKFDGTFGGACALQTSGVQGIKPAPNRVRHLTEALSGELPGSVPLPGQARCGRKMK